MKDRRPGKKASGVGLFDNDHTLCSGSSTSRRRRRGRMILCIFRLFARAEVQDTVSEGSPDDAETCFDLG